MKPPHAPASHPAFLPPGTQIGPWRVVAWAGQGVHGVIFQAVRIGQEDAGPVALKLALLPEDPRLAREVAVLSRVDHPSVPRLLDSGEWQHPGGTRHPFLVVEWVEGVPLYEWARLHSPRPEQLPRLLAQLAGALQALHAQGALHRDVKGANILVRRSDRRAMLMDFGSGTHAGAVSLTPPALVPGTPAYRSPEAALLELHSLRSPQARFIAGPADDVYALGVTACRLVTGEYPELGEPYQDADGRWHLESVVLPPALRDEGHVAPPLRELILRMLSVLPEERGTAAELATLLERAAEHLEQVSAPPSNVRPASARAVLRPFGPLTRERASRSGLAAAAVALALGAGIFWGVSRQAARQSFVPGRAVAQSAPADEGTTGLGDTASRATQGQPSASWPEAMSEDTLPEPLPGQLRPDAKGRCPGKQQVALNGACWLKASAEREECSWFKGQVFHGTCYLPCVPPGRQPTSDPP
jgi:eukaryotic-like serine/threonine-protein kinase